MRFNCSDIFAFGFFHLVLRFYIEYPSAPAAYKVVMRMSEAVIMLTAFAMTYLQDFPFVIKKAQITVDSTKAYSRITYLYCRINHFSSRMVFSRTQFLKDCFPLSGIIHKLSSSASAVLAEVSVKETLECLAVSSLVTSHFVNCVMNCIIAEFLCKLSEICLACCCAVFSIYTNLKVLFC